VLRKAINWKGEFDQPNADMMSPSNADFSRHFSQLLNSESGASPKYQIQNPKYIDPDT
jgi:hypothetical protein